MTFNDVWPQNMNNATKSLQAKSTSRYRGTEQLVLAACTLRRQIPKVGAECLNRARSDLCGGRLAISEELVSTADLGDHIGQVCRPFAHHAALANYSSGSTHQIESNYLRILQLEMDVINLCCYPKIKFLPLKNLMCNYGNCALNGVLITYLNHFFCFCTIFFGDILRFAPSSKRMYNLACKFTTKARARS